MIVNFQSGWVWVVLNYKQHLSFIITIASALSLLVPGILLKQILSPLEYGGFSMMVALIAVISSFGALGLEQVLNRFVDLKGSVVTFNRHSMLLLIFCLIIMQPVIVILSLDLVSGFMSLTDLVVLTIVTSISMITFNVCRLCSRFSAAQLVINVWKFSLLFALFGVSLGFNYFKSFLLIYSFSFIAAMIFAVYEISKVDIFIENKKPNEFGFFAFASVFNMATLTLIGYGDRFYIENVLGLVVAGEYYYLLQIYVFPFILVANYVGFKKMVEYKKEFNSHIFLNDAKLSLLLSVGIALCTYGFWTLISFFEIYTVPDSAFLPVFLLLGVVRLLYSFVSAYIGAYITYGKLIVLNVLFLLLLVLAVLFLTVNNILQLTVLVLFLWLCRTLLGLFLCSMNYLRESDAN